MHDSILQEECPSESSKQPNQSIKIEIIRMDLYSDLYKQFNQNYSGRKKSQWKLDIAFLLLPCKYLIAQFIGHIILQLC